MLPEVRGPEKSSDGNAIFLRDPYPDDLPVGPNIAGGMNYR
jgi:hypothetical protein